MDGVLIIDKSAGMTSHDVVGKARKILKTKRIGHTGTLDPFATGVMVLLVGKATRLAQFLDKDAKEYEAGVRFGFETETGDLTGERRTVNYEQRTISAEDIEKILPEFRGEISQIPPMYSAKKVEGKKLYELARKGIEIERKAVAVKIHKLELVRPDQAISDEAGDVSSIKIRVACSAGTYIRTLAEDLGRKLKIGAHLISLRRTTAGKFDLSQAVTLERLEETVAANKLNEVLISMNEAVSHLPEMKLDERELRKIQNGIKIFARSEFKGVQTIRLTDAENNLVAIGFYDETEKLIQPRLVLLN
jgi:tRNA pseudouridine55 synthase